MTVYVCDVSQSRDPDAVVVMGSRLPKGRSERWQRIRSERDARNHVLAYWLVTYALEQVTGKGEVIDWPVSPLGKPHVPGVEFNISHSRDRVVCAVSFDEVGVDVQYIHEIVHVEDLAPIIFADQENEMFRTSRHPEDVFFRFWVMKESFLKATGEGLNRDMRSIDLLEEDDDIMAGRWINSWRSGEYWFAICRKRCNETFRIEPISVQMLTYYAMLKTAPRGWLG